MKVLFIMGMKVSNWQKVAVLELLNSDEYEVFVSVVHEVIQNKKKITFLKKFDHKFHYYRLEAMDEDDSEIFAKTHDIKKPEYDNFFNFIINFSSLNEVNVNYGKILKPEINQDNWKNAVLLKSPKTQIRLLSKKNDGWDVENTLEFNTEKIICNNHDKALFFYTYLIRRTINGQRNISQIKSKNASKFRFALYYLSLLWKIIQGKLNKKELNWKLAVIINSQFKLIQQPRKTFWADPFFIKFDNMNWVFMEEYNFESKKGEIAVFHLDDNYTVQRKHTVIAEKEHLSFPNVFHFENDFYMMLEKSESCRLDIYKAEEMPFKWKYYKTILHDMKVVDPSWLFHNGKYYLFFNKVENHEYENNERLYIYFADDLFSAQWKEHPKNPVIIDNLGARNAGSFIKKENEIFRPAQDCSNRYGEKVILKKIIELSETHYEEQSVESFESPKGFLGLHTFNLFGDHAICDLLKSEK